MVGGGAPGHEMGQQAPTWHEQVPRPWQPQPATRSSAREGGLGSLAFSELPHARTGAKGWYPSQPPADCLLIRPPQPLQDNLISLKELLAACWGRGQPEEELPTPCREGP